MADLAAIEAIEADMREQAQGSQDGWLLDAANRLKSELTRAKGTGEAVAYIRTTHVGPEEFDRELFFRPPGYELAPDEKPLYASPPVALPEGWRDVMQELASDLESEINSRYHDTKNHPALALKYERDMEPVRKARAMLSSSPQAKEGGS